MIQLKQFFTFKRDELPLVFSMFTYFFLVITSFWILKPLKKSLFIGFYDQDGFMFFGSLLNASQAELIAKIANLFVAIGALWIFSKLAKHFKKEWLSYIFSIFFFACSVFQSTAIGNAGEVLVWTFYLYGDFFITLMVPAFFAFLNDSVTPQQSKRLYGPIVMGGVLGGVFGTTWVRLWIKEMSMEQWMWICGVMSLGILFAANQAGNYLRNKGLAESQKEETKAFESLVPYLRKTLKKPYILLIISVVGLYEMTSQIMDFQFSSVVSYYLDGPDIGKHFATVYAAVSWVSFLVQLLLTSFILTRLGVQAGLSILPGATLLASLAFVFAPILWIASLLPIFDNGLNYSINQSSREALYVPLDSEEKYQAKAFIDIFVMRAAKVLAIGVSFLVSSLFSEFDSLRWLSLCIAIIVSLWLISVTKLGKRYRELTKGKDQSHA